MDIAFNPFDPAFQTDPYPFYRQLRDADPVHWVDLPRIEIPGFDLPGIWVVTRYADVTAVLRDERFSVRRPMMEALAASTSLDGMTRSLLFVDPPDHTRLRTLVTKAFTPRVVDGLRPRIRAIVDELLRPAERHGRLELMRDLAAPLPVIVIAELLGIPISDRERFKQWSDDLVVLADGTRAMAGLVEAERAAGELTEYLRGVIAARRVFPRDDLISALVGAHDQGRSLSEEELLATCILLLVAGNETTTNLIGNAVLALCRHPDELARLRAEPSLVRGAVEECVRYDSPVQLTSRVATCDVELGGKHIRQGEEVDLILGAANRDPAQFADPDRLDVARPDCRPVSFGHGIHFCLGAALARVEGQIALETLAARFPRLRLDDEPPRWREGFVLRGPASLPLSVG
jgi:cytochrome P450